MAIRLVSPQIVIQSGWVSVRGVLQTLPTLVRSAVVENVIETSAEPVEGPILLEFFDAVVGLAGGAELHDVPYFGIETSLHRPDDGDENFTAELGALAVMRLVVGAYPGRPNAPEIGIVFPHTTIERVTTDGSFAVLLRPGGPYLAYVMGEPPIRQFFMVPPDVVDAGAIYLQPDGA